MRQFTTKLKPCFSKTIKFKCERHGHEEERKRCWEPRKEKDRYRGFIMVLNRKAIEFDTRAKNWQGPEGLAPKGGLGVYLTGKF